MNEKRGETADAVTLACVAALAGATVELAAAGVRRGILDKHVEAGWELAWQAPLSWVLSVAPLGVAVLLLARAVPRLRSAKLQALPVLLVAALGALFPLYPTISKLAICILAVGVGVQLSRVFGRSSDRFRRIARRCTFAGLAVLAATALGLHGGRAVQETVHVRGLPAPEAKSPNVLLLVLDTVRAANLSLHGHSSRTSPRLEALAARGTVFDRAYATAPWTLPSHASMFTGRYAHELSTTCHAPMDDAFPTLAEVLAGRGYETGGFVANVPYCSRETGLERGFAHYEDYGARPELLLTASSMARVLVNNPGFRNRLGYHDIVGRKTAAEVNARFLDWVGIGRTRPFFAFLNYYDAHEPYLPPPPWDGQFGPNPHHDRSMIRQTSRHMAERTAKAEMTEEERRGEEKAYDCAIAWLDDEIGRLLEELGRRGFLEDTVVVVTSDHGEHFGEHGLFSHANSLYLELLHVPFVMAGPGIPAGVRSPGPVSLRDLPATVLGVIGAPTGTLPGAPLIGPGAAGPAAAPSPVLSEVRPIDNQPHHYPSVRGTMHSLIRGEMHYILNGDGVEELYHVVADRLQAKDLSRDPAWAAELASLRAESKRLTAQGAADSSAK